MLQLLDGPSLDALESLADEPVPGSVLVFACRVPALAAAAAEQWGRRTLGSAFRRDFARMSPSGERWTVSEVLEIERALSVFPLLRHVVVVERAEEMDPRVADRLLRLLEEPHVPVSVVLVVPEVSQVPTTLRGRASVALSLFPAEPDAQVDALVASGFTLPASREAVALAGPLVDVLPALAGSAEVRSAVRTAVSARLDASAPVADAVSRLSSASRAACLLLGVDPRAWEDLDDEARVLARRLLRLFFAHRRESLASLLPRVDADQISHVARALELLDVAEVRLRSTSPPALVLAALAGSTPVVQVRKEAR